MASRGGGLTETDFTFIKEMINGPLGEASQDWPYIGRPKPKGFLYEIISNERNKVDVDKWDYFARDCHHCGIPNAFEAKRFMLSLRLMESESGGKKICARQKEFMSLFEMFHSRNTLHRKVCMHRVVKLIEEMASEALVKADPFIKIPGDVEEYSMSQAIYHSDAFINLTDDIWGQILRSRKQELEEAKHILMRIIRRDLYYVGEKRKHLQEEEANKAVESFKQISSNSSQKDNLICIKTKIDFGMKNKNPVLDFYFYEKPKRKNQKCFQISKENISKLLPAEFEEFTVIAYCKDKTKLESAKILFKNWRG